MGKGVLQWRVSGAGCGESINRASRHVYSLVQVQSGANLVENMATSESFGRGLEDDVYRDQLWQAHCCGYLSCTCAGMQGARNTSIDQPGQSGTFRRVQISILPSRRTDTETIAQQGCPSHYGVCKYLYFIVLYC